MLILQMGLFYITQTNIIFFFFGWENAIKDNRNNFKD